MKKNINNGYVKIHCMEESNNQWSTLLSKYLKKEINKEELLEMERQMASSPFKRRQFNYLTDPNEFEKQFQLRLSITKEESWKKLVAKAPFLQVAPVIPFYKKRNFWVVAASVILLISAAVFYFFPNTHTINKGQAIALDEPVVKPFSYVRLSTGQEYNLDESPRGVLYASKCATVINKDTLEVLNFKGAHTKKKIIIDLVTAPKGQRKIKLPDGSIVTLAAASYIRFALYFQGGERRIEIQGQAYCEVASNEAVPFIVALKEGVEARATGTSFNIRSYKNENTQIALLSGTLQMIWHTETFPMTKGQKVEFTREKKFVLIAQVDVVHEISWIKGEFNFENKNVVEMMHQIAAFYDYGLILADSLPDNRVSGKLLLDDQLISNIIPALEYQYDVNIKLKQRTLYVSSKK